MPYLCRKVTKWIEETVEKPVERWVEEQEERCRQEECNWLVLCLNKVVCWLVTILVKVVVWVTVTLTKRILKWVCELIDAVVEWVAEKFSPRRIDAHCHLFSIATGAAYILAGLVSGMLKEAIERPRPAGPSGGAIEGGNNGVGGLLTGLRAWSKRGNGCISDVFSELARSSSYFRFIVVPLMIDFAYCMDEEGLLWLRRRLEEVEDSLRSRLYKIGGEAGIEVRALFNDIVRIIPDVEQTSMDFEAQMWEYMLLKKTFPDRVYPFLGVDPRRPRILELVKEYVGPGKIFHGIKLYTPTGFSPTDPVLFGRNEKDDCVYRYCEDNRIPITVHCSATGFLTLADSVDVTGHVFIPEGSAITVDDRTVDGGGVVEISGRLSFNTSFLDGIDNMAAERCRLFAHPLLWNVVLQRYRTLYLNLAHFGGVQEMGRFVKNPEAEEEETKRPWTKIIVEMMDMYDNLYADLAAHVGYNTLENFKTNLWDSGILSAKVRSRILYGSDWDVLIFSEPDLDKYLRKFKEIFGLDFDTISIDNPKRFLFER